MTQKFSVIVYKKRANELNSQIIDELVPFYIPPNLDMNQVVNLPACSRKNYTFPMKYSDLAINNQISNKMYIKTGQILELTLPDYFMLDRFIFCLIEKNCSTSGVWYCIELTLIP